MTEKKQETKKKGLGCLPRLIILIIVLILAVYAAGKIFFPAEKVRAEIVKRASEMLGRTVELDEVSLSLLPTPTLDMKGLRIYNPEDFPGVEFVTIDRLACGLKIMPLLSKQFAFSEITIEHPVIRLRKTVDGRNNYSFTLDTGGEPIETPIGTKEEVTSEEAALTVFTFDWAEIKNGDLVYIDDSAQSKTVLTNFNLETKLNVGSDRKNGRSVGTLNIPNLTSTFIPEGIPLAINMAYNAEVDFQHADLTFKNTTLEINGIAFGIEATIRNLADPASIFAAINARDVSLEPLMEYIPASEEFDKSLLRLQGKLDGEVEARIEFGEERKPYLSGKFNFKDLTLGYQTVSTRVHFDAFKVDFDFDSVSFASEGGKLSDHDYSLAGSVHNWDDLIYSVRTKGSYQLSGLLPFMDPAYGHELSGLASFDLRAAGQKSKWLRTQVAGTIAIDKAFYTNDSLTSPLERFDLVMTLGEKKTSIDSLYVEYPGVKATLTGTLSNGFAHLVEPREGHKKPYLDFVLKSPQVNYDVLVPEEEEEAATGPGGSTEMAAPIFLPDIEAGGKVYIDTLVYSKVEFTNLVGDVGFKDGIITFKNSQASVYTGQVSAEGTVDINDMYQPAIACDFNATNIEANDFMARFANLDGHLYGKTNVKGNLTGKGAEFEDFVKSLVANGDFDLKEGRLVNFDLINNVAENFGMKTFKEESLRDFVGDLKIRDGKLLLDNTKLISKMGDWDVGGTVAFLEKGLDMGVSVYLSKDYSKDLDLFGGLLQDDKGRVRLSFNLGGTYDKPAISNLSTDNSLMKKKTEDMLKEGADKLLKNLFDKD